MRLKPIFFLTFCILTLFACHQPDHPAATRRSNLIAALKELRGRILSGDKAQIGRIFSFPIPDSVFNPYVLDSPFLVQLGKNGNTITRGMFDQYFDKISGAVDLDRFRSLFSFIDLDSLQHRDSIDVDTVLANDGSSRIYWIHIQGDSLIDLTYGTGHCQTPDPNPTAAASAAKDTVQTGKDTMRSAKDPTTVVKDPASVAKDTPAEDKNAGGGVDTVGSGDEEDDTGDPSACEHNVFWAFSFDGKTLRLWRQGEVD